jgi:hypothetical protein
MATHPIKGSPAAKAWALRMLKARMAKASIRTAGRIVEKQFFGPKGIFAMAGHVKHLEKNPGARWHEGMAQAANTYGRRSREPLEKAMFKGIEVAHRDSAGAARALKMNRERVIPSRRRRTNHNPLAVFGVANPPKRISTGIAGIVYGRCLEIRAEKLKFKPGLYKHPFSRKAGVQILALDNGDLLVHSTRGVNLWEPV